MTKMLLLVIVVLMLSFLMGQAYADRGSHHEGGSWMGRGDDGHHGWIGPRGFNGWYYRPYVAPYRYSYPYDNAFRVYPYSYYYGYAYPQYVVPPYYYYPNSGLNFFFRW